MVYRVGDATYFAYGCSGRIGDWRSNDLLSEQQDRDEDRKHVGPVFETGKTVLWEYSGTYVDFIMGH